MIEILVDDDLKELYDALKDPLKRTTYDAFKELLRRLYGCKKQNAKCDAEYKSEHDFV